MIDFATLQGLTIPEGVVTEIKDASGRVLWMLSGGPVILEVEKITSDTYAGETTYTGEQFILLDVYPKTNGTVSVTYGGLTKTITDTSGAAEPNAQQVFFGTFNGVSDSVTTPASGELTIEGDCVGFGTGMFSRVSKSLKNRSACVKQILSFGAVESIHDTAFSAVIKPTGATGLVGELVIPTTIKKIGSNAFAENHYLTSVIIESIDIVIGEYAFNCGSAADAAERTIRLKSNTPPTLISTTKDDGSEYNTNFGISTIDISYLKAIIVPKGCGAAYKAADGWSNYASYIVEES